MGVDVGTTRTKVVVYDSGARRIVARAGAPTPSERDAFGDVRDAAAVVAVVQDLIAQVTGDGATDPIAGIAVASVGEEVVVVDADGEPTGRVLSWYGPHGAAAQARMVEEGTGELVAGLDPSFSLFKLAWLARHRPDEVARAAAWTDLSGFVAARLAGPGAPVVLDASHASRTGMADPIDRSWNGDLVAAAGVADVVLPEIRSSGVVIATAASGAAPDGVVVATGGHDHFCGAFAAGVRQPGQAFVSAGTSEAQVLLLDAGGPGAHGAVDHGAFVVDGVAYAHLPTPSGRLYQTWRDLLVADHDDAAVMSAVAEVAIGSRGARVVVDRARGTADLVDVPIDASRLVLLRALMEGLAVEAERVTRALEDATGVHVDEVVVSGPPASSPTWRRLRAQVSQRRLRFVDEPESSGLGAALLAQQAVEGTADDGVVQGRAEQLDDSDVIGGRRLREAYGIS